MESHKFNATWSADSQRLAFVSNHGGGYDVYAKDLK